MKTAVLTIGAAALLALAACGGGGGSGGGPVTDGGNMPVQPGDTTPFAVQIGAKTNIRSIHLEMADALLVLRGPIVDKDNVQGGPVIVRDTVRWEMVCPGVPPRGNECSAPTFRIDGSRYNAIVPEDFSIEVQESLLESLIDRPSLFGGSINGVQMVSATLRPQDLAFEALGAWGEHFGMYSMRSNPRLDFHQGIRTHAASFGSLYSGYPTAAQGSATWYGPMVGHTRRDGIELAGDAELQYDFGANEVDLTLFGIDVSSILSPYTYSGPRTMQWRDLRVNRDGSFYIPGYGNDRAGTNLHPTLGYVDGDFYGPNAEEMAGVFERSGVVGAFGGKRLN